MASALIATARQQLLKDVFDKVTPEEFWHYVAKHRTSEGFYQNEEAINKRAEELLVKLGEHSFDRQASRHRWTPLQVAVTCGNVPAIRFFLAKGADPNVKNFWGQSALDSAKIFGLYPLFQRTLRLPENPEPFKLSPPSCADLWQSLVKNGRDPDFKEDPFSYTNNVISLLPPIYSREMNEWVRSALPDPIRLPADFTYSGTTNDFGVTIKKLLFGKEGAPSDLPVYTGHIIAGMKNVAAEEGFALVLSEKVQYPRDHFVRTPDGEVLLMGWPTTNENLHQIELAIQRGVSKTTYFEEGATYQVPLVCFAGCMGASLAMKSAAEVDHSKLFPAHRRYPLYIEGGNLLTATNSKGQRKVLVGRKHLAQIHAQFRLEKRFLGEPAADYRQDLSEESLKQVAEEMYAMGLISLGKGGKKMDLVTHETFKTMLGAFCFPEGKKLPFREAAIRKGLITPVEWSGELVQEVKPSVLKYLFQRDQVAGLVGSILGVPAEDVHFITQCIYHLDVFIKPGPRGGLFVQDFEACMHLLKRINTNWPALRLSPQECLMVARYLDTAEELQKNLGSSLRETRKELELAGFSVIPTPGIFYDQHYAPGARSYHLNFMNAISGWSEKNRRYYYVTTGIQIGERLGPLFQKYFAEFLKTYERNLKVHFVGENPEHPGDLSQAMSLWNQIGPKENLETGPMAGIHCYSYEVEQNSKRAE